VRCGREGPVHRFVATSCNTEGVMGVKQNVQLLLDVFSAIERRNDRRFRDLLDPDFEIHWPPSLPYGGTSRGPRPSAPTWSDTWNPLQPTEVERRMDPRVVGASRRRGGGALATERRHARGRQI
jgi:hypothetical protein